ncbi:hypothetical protein ACMA1I_20015 [Pontibacter sp. 13R65]|uniref:hypothetical protein n=1 Tax=Pontibacter sp. 13R65 TaxID=3127458 RepID=UPI00301E0F70
MKRIFTFVLALMLYAGAYAQAPEKMSYQAVIRNSSNTLVVNQAIEMHISILQGSATGTPVYEESQTPVTNNNGLVSIEIGTGTKVSGDFAKIDWANGPFFIKTVSTVPGTQTKGPKASGGTVTGISQLLSVPYAMYAKTSGSSLPGPAGPQGEQGMAGPAGPAGPAGAIGAKGDKGEQGVAGPQGEPGVAGATGAVGPQGEPGVAGPTGATGPVGPTGAQGMPGEAGAVGPAGPKGDRGEAGATGPQGPAGNDGATGPAGPAGPKGEQGIAGPQGEQGPAGPVGPQGERGIAGPEGPAGRDGATGPAGPQGEQGVAGAVGMQGPAGNDGIAGPAGPQGEQGIAGPKGEQGEAGPIGLQGPAGEKGEQGEQGAIGPAGPVGPQGEQGIAGATGPAGPQGEQGLAGPAGPKGLDGGIRTAFLRDERASGQHGGSSVGNTWNTRALNVLEGDNSFIQLAYNRFNLEPGKYLIEISAPAYASAAHQAKLKAIESNTDVLIGSTGFSHPSAPAITHSIIQGEIVISTPTTYEVQHRGGVERLFSGLGQATGFGTKEIYTQIKITKVE